MKKALCRLAATLLVLSLSGTATRAVDELQRLWDNPPEAAHPWVFWYWMEASVSREGIRADLQAMQEAGIAGAYLMPIKGPGEEPLMEPVVQLTPEWWAMIRYAFEEAQRLGLRLTIHACDGFAVAGGPWITPALSMQKVTWSQTVADGGRLLSMQLPGPEILEGHYRDIAVYAIPLEADMEPASDSIRPVVTTSQEGEPADYLLDASAEGVFRSREPAWIKYAFAEPFMARSLEIHPQGTNLGAKRLLVEASDDGEVFFPVRQLQSPRHGWQDGDAPLTYAIPPTRARFFRFSYDPAGTEPGSEDLDPAKWRPSLAIRTIRLMGRPAIHQYEGKSAATWRISRPTDPLTLPDYLCLDPDSIVRLDGFMDSDGHLEWEAPPGRWLLLRMGHTSTGHTNYTGGGGLGLEADKLNPDAVALQYDRWFGEVIRQIGPRLARTVLHGFHVDSWECGSQNWTPSFRDAFIRHHGYDPLDWLPVMAGIPIAGSQQSEAFLHDIRETINGLLQDNFFRKLKTLANEDGYVFSAESVAPTMMSDGTEHHGIVDLPMGEFWLRSPTHDKPNDILDAISGGHVYGKAIIQAEAFTQLRMAWDEHPGNLKPLGDALLAKGINRFVFHVFTHNPWLDRVPGMTLDGVGLYFQRDQTWWMPGRAWMNYLTRCQAFLQEGTPQADVAVYTGDSLPRRALLPDRLKDALPGLLGADRVAAIERRLLNEGLPLREEPAGVFSSANMEDPADWHDPLNGYAYDSLNQDALLQLAEVKNSKVAFPGGMEYSLLVIPGPRRMNPEGTALAPETIRKLYQLIHDGATVLFETRPHLRGAVGGESDATGLVAILDELWGMEPMVRIGKGRVIRGPWTEDDLTGIGIAPDLLQSSSTVAGSGGFAWNHRRLGEGDLYFLSNQSGEARSATFSFRVEGRLPELWDPVAGVQRETPEWRHAGGRTLVNLDLPPGGAVFIAFREATEALAGGRREPAPEEMLRLESPWRVTFAPSRGGPASPIQMEELTDWSICEDPALRYYSGTADYQTSFFLELPEMGEDSSILLDLGTVHNIAEVYLNGNPCGVAWTGPMQVEVTEHLQQGENHLRIEVTNTWANRLIGDHLQEGSIPDTWTRAPYRLEDGPLLPAGLIGPVTLLKEQ